MTCHSMCHLNLEACQGLNGGFSASKLDRYLARRGHDLPVTHPVCLPFKRLLHAVSLPMVDTGFSAIADIHPLGRLGQQCDGYLPVSAKS